MLFFFFFFFFFHIRRKLPIQINLILFSANPSFAIVRYCFYLDILTSESDEDAQNAVSVTLILSFWGSIRILYVLICYNLSFTIVVCTAFSATSSPRASRFLPRSWIVPTKVAIGRACCCRIGRVEELGRGRESKLIAAS